MSPFEHGEVFVLNDGGEVRPSPCRALALPCALRARPHLRPHPRHPPPHPHPTSPLKADLDLGNYERFLDITLTRDHNITTGKVYSQVIHAERRGDYLGKTVQVIPHVTDAIQNWLDRVSHQAVDSRAGGGAPPDICLVEVGGTVGDIESLVFLEALRQLQFRVRGLRGWRAGPPGRPQPPPPTLSPSPPHPLPLPRCPRWARRTFAWCTCPWCPCWAAWGSKRPSPRSTR